MTEDSTDVLGFIAHEVIDTMLQRKDTPCNICDKEAVIVYLLRDSVRVQEYGEESRLDAVTSIWRCIDHYPVALKRNDEGLVKIVGGAFSVPGAEGEAASD